LRETNEHMCVVAEKRPVLDLLISIIHITYHANIFVTFIT